MGDLTGVLRRDTAGLFQGPFRKRFWLYRIGLDVQEEMELQSGYQDVGTAHLPSWARSPYAGICGEWKVLRTRWRWFGVPLTRWRSVPRSMSS